MLHYYFFSKSIEIKMRIRKILFYIVRRLFENYQHDAIFDIAQISFLKNLKICLKINEQHHKHNRLNKKLIYLYFI